MEDGLGDGSAGVRGALAKATAALPGGGEARPGQVQMAEAVARAIVDKRHLVVQAGTGTGKSLAYLVPAVLSGDRVVVVTATKALQDQLTGKDLPFLAEALGRDITFSQLKGRSNYFCRQRAAEVTGQAGGQLQLDDPDDRGSTALGREVRRLLAWAASSPTGDRSELDFEPRPKAWSSVSVSAMECPGAARCPAGDECFAEQARIAAEAADILVVNTHLYAAHLASGGAVLPEHGIVVFDEAHEVEDVTAHGLGVDIGAGRLRALARTAKALLDGDEDGTAAVAAIEEGAERLEEALTPLVGRRLPEGLGELATTLVGLGERVRALSAAVKAGDDDADRDDRGRRLRVQQAAGHLAGDLAFAVTAQGTTVVWVERSDRAPLLRVAEVDVGSQLSTRLWPDVTAVLTSATIPPGIVGRLGLPPAEVDELDVGSPFPYGDHALLYCATHLPDPRSQAYAAAMHDELEAIITAAGGRTLALFTSWRVMEAAAEALVPRLPWKVLTQSDLPKPALVREFTADETSCLFATMGFWQGVDVPGPALSVVAIDKIPFPRPDDPLHQARRDLAGPTAFRDVDLPRAATMLAQGAGRLIRSAEDRGVVAVLDPRLASANYRWDLVRALPPMKRTRHRQEVVDFLQPVRSR